MIYLSIIFDILIIFLGVYFSIKRYQLTKRIDIFLTVNLILCLYYGLVPMLIKMFRFPYEESFMITLNTMSEEKYFFTSLICFLLHGVFILINLKIPVKAVKLINKDNNKFDKFFLDSRFYNIILVTAYLCFIIGTLSFCILAISVGGIMELIKIGDMSRGYGKDLSDFINSSLLPLRTIMPIVFVPPYLFYVLYKSNKVFTNRLMFWISMVIAILFLLFNAGRMPLIIFIAPFIVLTVFERSKYPWTILTVLSVLTIPLLRGLDNLFFYLSYGGIKETQNEISIIQYIIVQFGYPYINLLNINEMIGNFGYRFGIDFFTWLINIIPVSILSKFDLWKVNIITDYITEYYGTYISTRMSGGVPVDLYTLGYLQFGILGAIFTVIIFSYLIKYLDRKLYLDKFYLIKKILYLRIALVFGFLIPNISLDSIVRGRSDIIIIIIITILTHKSINIISEKKHNNIQGE